MATEQSVAIQIPGVGIPVRGRYDAMLELTSLDGQPLASPVRFLLDIKSVTSYVARQVASSGTPQAQDRAEMLCYLHATGCDWGIVLYHDKLTSVREPVPVFYSPQEFEAVAAWIRDVYAFIQRGEVPPAPYDPHTVQWPCAYCQYRTACIELQRETDGAALELRDHVAEDEAARLRERGERLLDRIIAVESEARKLLESTEEARRELAEIVKLVGRIDTVSGSAQLSAASRWDLDVVRTELSKLGLLRKVLDVSTSRLNELIEAGEIPMSLLAHARRQGEPSLRITRARGGRNGETENGRD